MQNAQNKKLQKCYKRITKQLQKSNKKNYNSITIRLQNGGYRELQNGYKVMTIWLQKVTKG